MYIEKIHIDAFGRLCDYDVELSPGVNIIEGANESGKSTLAAFIRFVLYGLPARERDGVVSWRSGAGGGAAGSITIRAGDRRYRVERVMVGGREAVQLIDAANNMPIRGMLDDMPPGELFFGVDADMFMATALVSQLGAVVNGTKVSDGIENILFSADETVNTQKALSKLDAARVMLLHKNEKGGRLFELDNEIASLEVRLSDALTSHRDILAKEAQLADVRANLESSKEKAQTQGARVKQFETKSLLALFDRLHALEKRIADLRQRIQTSGAPDAAYIQQLEEMKDRCEMLAVELNENQSRTLIETKVSDDDTLDRYIKLGGRAGVEAECRTRRSAAGWYLALAVILLLVGIGTVALGIVPALLGKVGLQPMLLIGGCIMLAAAVTLFILSARSRSRADELSYEYDPDELDEALESRKAMEESKKFALLAEEDLRRRLDEQRAKLEKLAGVGLDGLDAKIAKLKEAMRAVDGLKAEYDKLVTLREHMREQLAPYSEDELRARFDKTVDLAGIDAASLPAMRREAEVAAKMASQLEKHAAELDKTLAGLYPTAEDPTKLSDKLGAMKQEREELRKKHAAYKLAWEKLTEAGGQLRESVAPRLAADAAKLMERITDGKYRALGVGAGLDITAETEGGRKPLSVLSSGTQDAAYFSLRLALVALLYRKELPPMIYDETFARQDDARLSRMLDIIRGIGMQSLVFTANSRDAAAMSKLGEFKQIRM